MKIAALDIGGANIKGALHGGSAFTIPFELWRSPEALESMLDRAIRERFGAIDILAVTMTGELCDCFATKAEGVTRILESVRQACSASSRPVEVLVWRTDSRLAPLDEALRDPLPSAAANWLALAHLASEHVPQGRGLLIDVGSTTTDIVPLRDRQPVPQGRTDTERLLSRELVYTGVSRTPVASLVRELTYRGRRCPVSSELFATTLDAYLTLGLIPEDADLGGTADGRESTRDRASDRLARMICADAATFSREDAVITAREIAEAQASLLSEAIDRVASTLAARIDVCVVSGSGEFLAAAQAGRVTSRVVRLSSELGAEASAAAPAVALARIASRSRE